MWSCINNYMPYHLAPGVTHCATNGAICRWYKIFHRPDEAMLFTMIKGLDLKKYSVIWTLRECSYYNWNKTMRNLHLHILKCSLVLLSGHISHNVGSCPCIGLVVLLTDQKLYSLSISWYTWSLIAFPLHL